MTPKLPAQLWYKIHVVYVDRTKITTGRRKKCSYYFGPEGVVVYEYYEGPPITYSYSLATSLTVLIDCTNSFVFVCLKRLLDSRTNIRLMNTYSYILLYFVERFCIFLFFIDLLRLTHKKQIGIPTYYNSSQVNTRDKCS